MTSLAAVRGGDGPGGSPAGLPRGRLGAAGLTAAEESVYVTLLGLPPVTVQAARRACPGIDPAEVPAILDGLAGKGLLTESPGRPRRYAPAPPQHALHAALDQQEHQLRQARAAVAGLADRYRAVPRPSPAGDLTEIITGAQHTRDRWHTALDNATHQVRLLHRPPSATGTDGPHPAEPGLLARGIPVRCIYDDSSLPSPATLAHHHAGTAASEQARVTGQLPLHLLITDDTLALTPLALSQPRSDGLLAIHPGPLLDGLAALFELAWATALPLSPGPGGQPPDGQPAVLHNPTTRTILALLAAGLTDRSIARRLHCSERTVQRHIHRLTQATGAKTRFQTALQIAHHHWTR